MAQDSPMAVERLLADLRQGINPDQYDLEVSQFENDPALVHITMSVVGGLVVWIGWRTTESAVLYVLPEGYEEYLNLCDAVEVTHALINRSAYIIHSGPINRGYLNITVVTADGRTATLSRRGNLEQEWEGNLRRAED